MKNFISSSRDVFSRAVSLPVSATTWDLSQRLPLQCAVGIRADPRQCSIARGRAGEVGGSLALRRASQCLYIPQRLKDSHKWKMALIETERQADASVCLLIDLCCALPLLPIKNFEAGVGKRCQTLNPSAHRPWLKEIPAASNAFSTLQNQRGCGKVCFF